MESWEGLFSGPSAPQKPANAANSSAVPQKKEKPAALKDPSERFADSANVNGAVWKDLREYESYSAGRMYGACQGPDQAGLKDILTKFASMAVNLIKDSYWKAEKPFDRDTVAMLELAAKVAANMDKDDTKIPPIKMVAYLNGFCDGYIASCDPESVRNLSYGVL